MADLYAPDGRLLGIGPDKVDRADIAEWADARQAMVDRRSRHVQSNLHLVPEADGTARGTVVLTLYRHDGPGDGTPVPLLIGKYEDIYASGPDGAWRFAERRLTILFVGVEIG